MFSRLKKFFQPLTIQSASLLIGGMVGVGVFGIPFAFSKAGFAIGVGLLFLVTVLTLIIDLMYGEVILRTHEKHQLVGYADKYLGHWAKRLLFFAIILGTYGALLAYLIVAGDFIHNLLSPIFFISKFNYSLIFFIICSSLILLGIKSIARVELILAGLFGLVVLVILGTGLPHIEGINFLVFNPESWFLPYGILLFAFAGFAAIPLQRRFLGNREDLLKNSITLAVFFVGLLYLVFSFVVIGVSGELTSPDTVSGLFGFIGTPILVLISIFGLLAVTTSFILLGSALSDVFILDYKMGKLLSWFWTVFPPFILFSIGIRTFIDVISMIGSLAIALELIILIFIFQRSREIGDRVPEYSLGIPVWILYLIISILAGGMLYAVIFI